jgi:hypothetical protein
MKVTVVEVRKARFQTYTHVAPTCHVDFTYKVIMTLGPTQGEMIFDRLEDAEEYIKYIKEMENDYEKVIKEIEI